MNKQFYPWWGYVRSIVRKYKHVSEEDIGVGLREKEAVRDAIEATAQMADGRDRLNIIGLVHWDRTHTLDGAAIIIPCSRRTAAYWQREFFEMVARNRDLLD